MADTKTTSFKVRTLAIIALAALVAIFIVPAAWSAFERSSIDSASLNEYEGVLEEKGMSGLNAELAELRQEQICYRLLLNPYGEQLVRRDYQAASYVYRTNGGSASRVLPETPIVLGPNASMTTESRNNWMRLCHERFNIS